MLIATVGFRAHSGWAAAVAVSRADVVDRRHIQLCDCLVAGSKQPYHSAAAMPLPRAEAFLERCREVSAATAESALRKMLEELAGRKFRVNHAVVLLGAGRLTGDLAKTLASHAAIHTAEGEFYREVIREACRRCGLPVTGVSEKELCLRVEEVAGLGKQLGPPWRADEKLCALAAMNCNRSNGPERRQPEIRTARNTRRS